MVIRYTVGRVAMQLSSELSPSLSLFCHSSSACSKKKKNSNSHTHFTIAKKGPMILKAQVLIRSLSRVAVERQTSFLTFLMHVCWESTPPTRSQTHFLILSEGAPWLLYPLLLATWRNVSSSGAGAAATYIHTNIHPHKHTSTQTYIHTNIQWILSASNALNPILPECLFMGTPTGHASTLGTPLHWARLYTGHASTLDTPLHWTRLYTGHASTLDTPLHRTRLYTGHASTLDTPLHWTRLYTGHASTLDTPLHWTRLYTGHASTQDTPLHWARLYTGHASTLDTPLHWTRLYTGHASALGTPLHWVQFSHSNYQFLLCDLAKLTTITRWQSVS